MHDKYVAHVFFEEHDIPSPRSWLPEDVPEDARYPVLVKVREGFGSRHIYRAGDRDELDFFLRYTTVDSFVQECCRGEEFSIDVFCDLDSRCLNAIPRTMIQSKGGESIKGISLKDEELIRHGARVAETVGIVGPANIQCFRELDGDAARDRREPTLRRRLSAAVGERQPLPGARSGSRARGAPAAASGGVQRRHRDDSLPVGRVPGRERRRAPRAAGRCRRRGGVARALNVRQRLAPLRDGR